MATMTKKSMIAELVSIWDKMMVKGELRGYPFSPNQMMRWKTEQIQRGLELYKTKGAL